MIILGDTACCVARRVDGAIERSGTETYDRKTPAETADRIRRLLDDRQYRGEVVVLGLGSSWCVSATIPLSSARQARNRSAMGYLMEPCLPWAAEEAVVDYEVLDGEAFLVAAEAEPLKGLVRAFQERRIAIATIAPVARLALEHQFRMKGAFPDDCVLFWGHEATLDLWLIKEGRPTCWTWLPCEDGSIDRALREITLRDSSPRVVVGRNLPQGFLEAAATRAGLSCGALPSCDTEDPIAAALTTSTEILKGRSTAPIELLREPLPIQDAKRSTRRHLRALQSTLLLCLASAAAALFGQTRQFNSLAEQAHERQLVVFQKLFPNQRVPIAVSSRLEGELARLKGLRGQRTDLPVSITALAGLERLLKALPSDLRLRILEVRMEREQVYVVGQVRSHGDADRIATALRGVKLDVASPSTHRLDKEGVEFRISAKLPRVADSKPRDAT
jgi:hypothetical protein